MLGCAALRGRVCRAWLPAVTAFFPRTLSNAQPSGGPELCREFILRFLSLFICVLVGSGWGSLGSAASSGQGRAWYGCRTAKLCGVG